jgi:hypothetical protein
VAHPTRGKCATDSEISGEIRIPARVDDDGHQIVDQLGDVQRLAQPVQQ